MDQDLITRINSTNKDYFERNPVVRTIPTKDLMPEFIKAGIFAKNYRDGLPVRNLLRELDRSHALMRIPFVRAKRKRINTLWFFDNVLVG